MNPNAKGSNQPWTIIGGGAARAYFELAELLEDPKRFGFDETYQNVEEG